jgi:hypothetical protein
LALTSKIWPVGVLLLAACATSPESLGAIQQQAIAECEKSSPGAPFKSCFDAYVEEHRRALARRPLTPEELKSDFFLDLKRVP